MEKKIINFNDDPSTPYKRTSGCSLREQQVGGNHYKKMAIQPVEFILANGLGFCEGNILKYICRWRDKNGIEDLEKAQHYLDILIENAEKYER